LVKNESFYKAYKAYSIKLDAG
jgi:hypothetical protein